MSKTRTHRLLWSTRYQAEHDSVMAECKRVAEMGGSFEIKNDWLGSNWYSFITIYYPEGISDE